MFVLVAKDVYNNAITVIGAAGSVEELRTLVHEWIDKEVQTYQVDAGEVVRSADFAFYPILGGQPGYSAGHTGDMIRLTAEYLGLDEYDEVFTPEEAADFRENWHD